MESGRKFSKTSKRRVVEELLAGQGTQAQLARRYSVSDNLILEWKRRYAEGKLEEIASPTNRDGHIK